MSQISLLLGAGFSVNKGYPTANRLNENIINLKTTDFTVAPQGSVCWLENGQEDIFAYSANSTFKLFTLELIAFYASTHNFNYEEFFDYYTNIDRPENRDEAFEQFCDAFREKQHIKDDNLNLISRHNSIFNQIISGLLIDREGNHFYERIHHIGYYDGYNGFLGCIQSWGKENVLHIHTLNHDLFLEALNHTDAINGELSDGFTELGSPYYGELESGDKIRLSYFSGIYDTNYRLYKLHGSLDQYPFHSMNDGQIGAYIKTKPGIGVTDFYKEEQNDEGKLEYVNDFINYFPDFLSGTTSKILRYRDPIYYEEIFKAFEANLQASQILVLIGYGCGDSEVNNIILNNFKGLIYLVDPFPSAKTYEFCDKTGAKLIEKTPENIGLPDFG
ncbi:hypothetical protein RYH73_25700 [Olivibacter sp. CPCC 100613]|uniref:hypothetical protein n=1 Tax=Olivibacter sp. CPCC 100613 TaxID=3079931 RepID=UPI002FFBDC55